MWKNASTCLLLSAAALLSAGSVAAQRGADVLLSVPIDVDGVPRDLRLLRGESYENAAVSFARDYGLLAHHDNNRVRAMIDELSGLLKVKMEEIHASEAAEVAAAALAAEPTVQLTMPLTINDFTTELKKYESETVEAAVERFLFSGGYSMEAMRELYPQLTALVNEKMASLAPPRKELFSFSLTIDQQQAIARHFEGGEPAQEAAETLRSIGITDADTVRRLAPQIANEILKRIAGLGVPAPAQEPVAPAAPMQPPAAPPKELFSMSLTVNNKALVLVHSEGLTARDSAVRFLRENGLTNEQTVNELLPQLVQIIENKMNERLQQEAESRAIAEAEAAARREAEEAARRAAARVPLMRLPISLGNDQQAILEYFEGDDVEQTVHRFLSQIGLERGPVYDQNAVQLVNYIRQQLAPAATPQQQPEAPPQEPFVSFPVTLGTTAFTLEYFAGQEPGQVANTFCVEKYEQVRNEQGLQFDTNQLNECKNVLENSLRNLIAQKQQQQQQQEEQQRETREEPSSQQQQQPDARVAPPKSRGELLMTLDIELNDGSVPLAVHQNDDLEQIAREFCETHRVGLENVPTLVDAIRSGLAELK
ncbi:hypothetical protein PINS_up000121 [Pythium insidiosum]|nr:hypothetical protein PINS_up000121 [Pythium insidiosum]